MKGDVVVITKAYLQKHSTKSGAWTKAQINALGLEWPVTKGWQKRLEGTEITREQANDFENGRNRKVSGKSKQALILTNAISKDAKHLNDVQLIQVIKTLIIEYNQRPDSDINRHFPN